MKLEHNIILIMGLLISATLVLITIQPEEIPHWNYLQEITQQEFEICDKDCKTKQEKQRDYFCTEIQTNDFVCRPPRDIFWEDQIVQIKSAFPPNYGEFAYFPEGKVDEKDRLFDIVNLDLVNKETKEIMIEFGYHNPELTAKSFEYSTFLHPGDTFVSHCLGGESKIAHIVEYLDTFDLDGTTYVEFWGIHVTMPDELLPCEMPDLIQHTLQIDLSIGIDFDMD